MEKYKIPLAIILAAVIIGLALFFGLKSQQSEKITSTASPTISQSNPTITMTQTAPSPTLVPISLPSPAFSEDDADAIKTALSTKLGTSKENLVFEVSKKDDKHAKGNVREKTSEVGGGYWLAAKTDSSWSIVYDGQANPTCGQIAPYNFSTEMVPECLNNLGNVVTR